MKDTTDKLAEALRECSEYLAEFFEEGSEHRVIVAADAALAEYDASSPAPLRAAEVLNNASEQLTRAACHVPREKSAACHEAAAALERLRDGLEARA